MPIRTPGGLRLGVVIPTLDEEAWLPRLLERLLEQPDGAELPEPADRADRADRVVVSDGGSRDRTVELARAAGCRVVVGPRGRGGQLARGARELDCEVLLFLHADVLPAPGALTAVRAAFEDPALVATAMVQRIEAPGTWLRLVERFANLRARCGIVYGDSGLGVRRSAYEGVGGFRDLPLFEDVDLSRRLRRAGRVELVRGARLAVSARRWQAEGALRATARNWILTVGYLLGLSPESLARWYPSSRPGAPDQPAP